MPKSKKMQRDALKSLTQPSAAPTAPLPEPHEHDTPADVAQARDWLSGKHDPPRPLPFPGPAKVSPQLENPHAPMTTEQLVTLRLLEAGMSTAGDACEAFYDAQQALPQVQRIARWVLGLESADG